MTTPQNPPGGVAAVIVLAAGAGTRMKSKLPKVLHRIGGRTMIGHAVVAAAGLHPEHLMVVVGHGREEVTAHLDDFAPGTRFAVQDVQRGTGHAVQVALAELGELTGEVVVTYGDVPMLDSTTLSDLLDSHRAAGNAITVLTAVLDDPTGYGRILRSPEGGVAGIVEHRDADEAQRAITEINSGIYVFDAAVLTDGLTRIGSHNAQGELYLTDVLGVAVDDGRRVGALVTDDLWQTEGINDRVQLSRVGLEMNRRILERWMRAGVTIVDPQSTWIDADVTLGTDVVLNPDTELHGATTIAEDCVIGPATRLTDCEVAAGATVLRTEALLATIGAGATVGPFSYLRPGTQLGADGKIGAYCETKKAVIGRGSKVPHLSYVGDATIGDGVNIGAGVIFANYDGTTKSASTIGDGAFVGSGSVLVAPADIAEGAYVAAGSTITDPVGSGDLGVARGRQRNVEGWVGRRRGSDATTDPADRPTDRPTD